MIHKIITKDMLNEIEWKEQDLRYQPPILNSCYIQTAQWSPTGYLNKGFLTHMLNPLVGKPPRK